MNSSEYVCDSAEWADRKQRFPVGAQVSVTVLEHFPFGMKVRFNDSPDITKVLDILSFHPGGFATPEYSEWPDIGSTITVTVSYHDEWRHGIDIRVGPSLADIHAAKYDDGGLSVEGRYMQIEDEEWTRIKSDFPYGLKVRVRVDHIVPVGMLVQLPAEYRAPARIDLLSYFRSGEVVSDRKLWPKPGMELMATVIEHIDRQNLVRLNANVEQE